MIAWSDKAPLRHEDAESVKHSDKLQEKLLKHSFFDNKFSRNSTERLFLPIFPKCLPLISQAFSLALMKTAHTLILLRQHACLRLVSPRLRS
ncbi:hypothetical protein ACNFH8_18880 [Pseudomonas sp. NY15436]|uniref:hypothetical protein n=1 Tax=Pseudomonas sp. NY15436 TaxID=3400359 RepID=UPI003A8919AB